MSYRADLPPSIARNVVVASAFELVNQLQSRFQSLPVRLLGSTAVAIRCPKFVSLWESLSRPAVSDIDLVSHVIHYQELIDGMRDLGYVKTRDFEDYWPMRDRLRFREPNHQFEVEIFFDPMQHLNHIVPLNGVLTNEAITIPLTYLVLTKLQYEHELIREEQIIDLVVLFAEHGSRPLGTGELSFSEVAELARRNWEMEYTFRNNLIKVQSFARSKLRDFQDGSFPFQALQGVLNCTSELIAALENSRKTLCWYLRSWVQKLLPCYPIGRRPQYPTEDIWQVRRD